MSVYGQYIFFFYKFNNFAAIFNIFAYFSRTHPEMHVYQNLYVHTYQKDAKKYYGINVHSRWHLAPSEADLIGIYALRQY